MTEKNSLPNLFIAGAAKSGTTFLYNILKQHPEISNYGTKEPHIFKESVVDTIKTQIGFNEKSEYKLDASVEYIINHKTLDNIHSYNLNAKFIYVLRNQLDQLYSHYYHRLRTKEINISWPQLLYKNHDDELFRHIEYGKNLQNLYNRFLKYNVLLISFEELTENTESVIKNIMEFLELRGFNFSYEIDLNKGFIVKNPILYKISNSLNFIIKKILKFNLFPVLGITSLNKRMNDSDKYYLKNVLQDDIALLNKLNPDLQSWNLL